MEIISERLYDRYSEQWGKYKVTRFIEERGKSKVKYFEIKFQESGNTTETSLKNILDNKVIDIDRKKNETKKRARLKKREIKDLKWKERTTIEVEYGNSINLLALDLATISTGWAVSINGKFEDFGYLFISDKNNKLTNRINFMKKEIIKLIEKWNINCVILEDVINKDVVSTVALSKLSGVILDTLFEIGIQSSKLHPKSWKTLANINQYKNNNIEWEENTREESKELTYLYVKDKLKLDIKKEFEDVCDEHKDKLIWQDVCDAITLGDVFFKNNINIRE